MAIMSLRGLLLCALAAGCIATEPPDIGDGGPSCATADSYRAATNQEAEEAIDEDGDHFFELLGELAFDPLDELSISLWDDYGVFEGTVPSPGTYSITGADTDLGDCGVCVTIAGDVDLSDDTERQLLMAQSGTVVIDSITGEMSGNLAEVVLAEINPATELLIPGGCQTVIPSLNFRAPLE
jgi:hypothetical protein